jgi:putative ABC transport system permease protein
MTPFALTDFRDAVRGLRRTPAVTLCAVACLTLGLGATTAIASAIDQALIKRLPFRDPGDLTAVYRTGPQANDWPFSAAKFLDLALNARRQELAAMASTVQLISLPSEGVQVPVVRVTGNFFSMLGVRAMHGRVIGIADDRLGQGAVAVMSDEFWHQRFGADPTIVGRTIIVDGTPTTIIGTLAPGFHVPHGRDELSAPLWVPTRFTASERNPHNGNFLKVLGRLKSGATVGEANLELRSLVDGMIAIYPMMHGESARAVPLQSDSVQGVRTPLLLVFGAVCAVLLIAAANAGSLILARGVRRERETAVRAALGASQWAVMRPVVAECLILTTAGGLAGLAVAWLAVRAIGRVASAQLPQLAGVAIEVRIVVFALGLTALVALACGALPAWHSTTVDPEQALRGGSGGGGSRAQHRALSSLVIGQVALSLTLLIGASLVFRGFTRLVNRDPGIDPRPVLTLTASVSPQRYGDSGATRGFLRPALAAIEQLPGVQSAGGISDLPYSEWGSNSSIRYEGQPNTDPDYLPRAEDREGTPDLYRAFGQRLTAGRALRWDDDDRPGVPRVVMVNEALVRRDFPRGDAVGKRFYIRMSDTAFATIAGVVSDIPNAGPIDPPIPEVYWPYTQGGARGSSTYAIVVRAARGDPTALEHSVRAAILTVDPGAAISRMEPMTDVMAESIGTPRFYLTLIGTFALVAVVLAVAGLYGVMSYAVAQRTRELGIRAALGSPRSRTLRMVIERGMRLVGIGVVGGAIGGAVATRVLASLLYGVSPADPPTWIVATLALVVAGVMASVIPAVRAMKADPVIAIRTE